MNVLLGFLLVEISKVNIIFYSTCKIFEILQNYITLMMNKLKNLITTNNNVSHSFWKFEIKKLTIKDKKNTSVFLHLRFVRYL